MHTLLDYEGNLPACMHISDRKTTDIKGAYEIRLLNNSLVNNVLGHQILRSKSFLCQEKISFRPEVVGS